MRSRRSTAERKSPPPQPEELRQHGRDSHLPGGGTGARAGPVPRAAARQGRAAHPAHIDPVFRLPPTDLLNEPPARNPYDEQELKETASRIKAKFEEFNVLGNVVQINPGPVVTTFEFKPEAGMKYAKIINLREDLCLGLHAESILIERIPGKPTVGIEVPNTRRELIALRQLLESDEFQGSHSYLTIPLGKDINGRIRVAALETMPHLLIAGSTGSGKSVMINSMIMSILYKATPDEVRLIMVDPKRVELGMYEGIPHLLTPVITDPKKATNALRNAVLEMERRLRLLAEYGVRNIDQFNKKIRKLQETPRDLFAEEGTEDAVRPLPYILILIDELADLMMLEGKNVEESVTRLAQMARAVGMHLVLATQRPSVDVITGLIKANFPARISFRVATRVDSRTILDVMGSEHLLGKGDMLFLPPGSARLTRVHGAFVTETEIQGVVDFWKAAGQARIRPELPDRAARRRRRGVRGRAFQRGAGSAIRGCRSPRAADGKGFDVHLAAALAPGLRARGAHSGLHAARRHHRSAGRQQAARSAEAPRLAARSGSAVDTESGSDGSVRPPISPRSLEFAHQFLDVLQLFAQEIQLARQALDLRFGAPVDGVIQLAAQAVLGVLPVLAHHDHRRLHRCQHGEKQIQQDERVRIPRLPAEPHVDGGVDDQHEAEGNDEGPRSAESRHLVGNGSPIVVCSSITSLGLRVERTRTSRCEPWYCLPSTASMSMPACGLRSSSTMMSWRSTSMQTVSSAAAALVWCGVWSSMDAKPKNSPTAG